MLLVPLHLDDCLTHAAGTAGGAGEGEGVERKRGWKREEEERKRERERGWSAALPEFSKRRAADAKALVDISRSFDGRRHFSQRYFAVKTRIQLMMTASMVLVTNLTPPGEWIDSPSTAYGQNTFSCWLTAGTVHVTHLTPPGSDDPILRRLPHVRVAPHPRRDLP
jgi:hypothetical protein